MTDLRRFASTGTSDLRVHTRFARDDAGRLTAITHGIEKIAWGEFWDRSSTPPPSLGTSGLLAGFTFDYDQAHRLTVTTVAMNLMRPRAASGRGRVGIVRANPRGS